MEATVPPLENFPKREVEESKGATEISGSEDHDDCYEIDFIDDDEEDDDDDQDYCYVIDHSNHRENYVTSHCEMIAVEGYDNGDEDEDEDEDEYDDSDLDDDEGDEDDDEEDADDSDDDSCIEIVPAEFSQKISIPVSNDALAT